MFYNEIGELSKRDLREFLRSRGHRHETSHETDDGDMQICRQTDKRLLKRKN